ncbi:PREDICTED: uncharacterized protein LOC105974803 [Erythranthe guttata]|nr:PREDICTED: uncharacterized protein LOC105974803 [Erythranthe guttata]|eukprot:XP_012855416.1 PREDICTED: uncharacterized protein LOC105974803 [Erythranthe guttata]
MTLICDASVTPMAETQEKRLREESHDSETPEYDDANSNSKRQKPYNNILSLLDEEEVDQDEEPTQDLSAIFTTLEQEISSTTTATAASYDVDFPPFEAAAEEEDHSQQTAAACSPSSGDYADEDDGVKSVMRHLLEASDDELGIPTTEDNYNSVVEINYSENFPFGFSDHGIWEMEDVAANYYTMLQSELFM